MPRKTTSLRYRNLYGQPLGGAGDLSGAPSSGPPARRQEGDAAAGLTETEVDRVFDALALAGWRRGKTALMNLMRVLDLRRDGGRAFDNAEIAAALRRLHATGRVQTVEGEGWYVPEALAEARLAALLVTIDAGAAWRALVWAAGGAYGQVHPVPAYFSPRGDEEAVAVMRLVLVSGIDAPAYASLSAGALRQANVSRVVSTVLAQLQRLGLFERVDPTLRWWLLAMPFAPAWKALCAHLGKRSGFAPASLLQWYPLALTAQVDATAWTAARKFCITMAGSRTPSPFDRWAHVLAVRLGDARLEAEALHAGRHATQELRDPDGFAAAGGR